MKELSVWGSFYWVIPVVVFSLFVVILAEGKSYRKPLLWGMLIVWVAGVTYLMFLYRLPGGQGKLSFDFFHMYRMAKDYTGSLETNQALRQILFNVLMYVPLGAVLCTLTGKRWMSICIGIGVSILTESLQYFTGLGMTDVDDVISNTLGLMLGVVAYTVFECLRNKG